MKVEVDSRNASGAAFIERKKSISRMKKVHRKAKLK